MKTTPSHVKNSPCAHWPQADLGPGVGSWRNKIFAPHSLPSLKSLPRPMVLTNGVFDLIHAGHIFSLESARQQGACLVVAMNSDASARGLGKGRGRPYQTQCARAAVLAAMSFVDVVVFFDEPTPLEVLKALQPEIYVKGAEYAHKPLPEAEVIKAWGARVLLLPYWEGLSTSAIVQAVKAGER